MKNKSFWLQSGLILATILIFFLPIFIKNQGILIYYGDSFEEFYQFYLGGWEKVHALDFSQFDWSIGLGGNWFAYSDVYLLSPYFWLTVPFPKSWLPYEMTALNILKLLLTFQFTYLWISKITKNELTRFVCGAMVAFSGWVFFYNHYTNFLDAYLMFPLILYFAECYLQSGKFKGFVLSMCALTLQTYYFAYMFMPFGCLYGLFRYLMMHEKINIKDLLITALKYFGLLMLGIGMAACILLPTANTLFGNPRMEETYGFFDTIGKYDIFKIITSLFTPVFSRLNPDYFISVDKIGDLGWGYGCSLFSLILFPVLFLQLFGMLKKREIRWILGFYLLLSVFVLFPTSWLILQGTIDTRWFFMIVLLNALSSCFVLDAYFDNKISGKKMNVTIVIVFFIIIGLFLFSVYKGLNTYEMLKKLFYVLMIEFFILAIYYLSFWKKKKIYILIGVSCEIILSGLVHVYYNPPREHALFDETDKSACVIAELSKVDKSFYRIIYDNENFVTANEPFANNYPGVSFYYSIYNFEQEDFLNRFKSTWSMPMVSGRTISLNQLSAKYWYTKGYTNRPPYGYEYFDTLCGYDVYKNNYYIPLAYLENQTANTIDVLELNYLEQDLLMMNAVVLDNGDKVTDVLVPFEKLGVFSVSDVVSIPLEYEKPISTVYIVPEKVNPEINLEFRVGNEKRKEIYFYQVGYVDYFMKDDYYDEIVITYNNLSGGIYDVYLENHDEKWYEDWYQSKKKSFIDNIKVEKNEIVIKVSSEKNQYIVTSIPYDKGWKCFVDGKEVEYVKANMGFIAVEISEGSHDVLFEYHAPWFKEGIIISILSVGIFLFLVYKENKK